MSTGLLARVPDSLRPIVALALKNNGSLSDPLQRLLKIHNILCDRHSLAGAVTATQAAWRQAAKAGEIPADADNRFSAAVKRESLALLDTLGQGGQTLGQPSLECYDTALIHEHYPLEVYRRFESAGVAWKRGIRFGRVAILGCAMPVAYRHSVEHLWATGAISMSGIIPEPAFKPTTLVGSASWLLRNGPFPWEMRQLPIDLISTGFRRSPEDTGHEYTGLPDTGDSVRAWWEAKKLSALGNVLAVSNGWQYARQVLVTWTELVKIEPRWKHVSIDGLSGAPGYNYSLTMRLRELAGFLWTLHNEYLKPHLGWGN